MNAINANGLKRFPLAKIDELKPNLDGIDLIEDWLGIGGLSMLYAPSNTGKTLVALYLGLCVASGQHWNGYRTQHGRVVYLSLEGGGGIVNRIEAYRLTFPKICEGANFEVYQGDFSLMNVRDIQELALSIGRCDLIIVDTLARALAGCDENSSKDIGQAIRNVDMLRKLTHAHVMLIHHTGKNTDAGARGSSALRSAVDTEISINLNKEIKITKQRDREPAKSIYFDIQSVKIGNNAYGKDVCAGVAIPSKIGSPTPHRSKLSSKNEVALNALHEAIEKEGTDCSIDGIPWNRKSVTIEIWKVYLIKHGFCDDDKSDAFRQAIRRAREKLIDSDRIQINGDRVWVV